MEGQETVHSVCGPLTHSIKDMKLFVTSVLQQQPWLYDSKVIPMPWRQAEEDAVKSKISSGGLTLGFYSSDGNVRPHPPVARGIDMVVETLQKNGHTVVPWKPYKHEFAVDLINGIYASDAGKVVLPHSLQTHARTDPTRTSTAYSPRQPSRSCPTSKTSSTLTDQGSI